MFVENIILLETTRSLEQIKALLSVLNRVKVVKKQISNKVLGDGNFSRQKINILNRIVELRRSYSGAQFKALKASPDYANVLSERTEHYNVIKSFLMRIFAAARERKQSAAFQFVPDEKFVPQIHIPLRFYDKKYTDNTARLRTPAAKQNPDFIQWRFYYLLLLRRGNHGLFSTEDWQWIEMSNSKDLQSNSPLVIEEKKLFTDLESGRALSDAISKDLYEKYMMSGRESWKTYISAVTENKEDHGACEIDFSIITANLVKAYPEGFVTNDDPFFIRSKSFANLDFENSISIKNLISYGIFTLSYYDRPKRIPCFN